MRTPLKLGAHRAIDNGHTAAVFKISHMGFSNTHGRFNKISGSFTDNSIEVEIDAAQGQTLVDGLGAAIVSDLASGDSLEIVDLIVNAGLSSSFGDLFELRYPGFGDWVEFFGVEFAPFSMLGRLGDA